MRKEKRRRTVWAGGHAICCEWIHAKTPKMPTLIFLHEGLGSIRQWRDLPETLGRISGFDVLVFDRFGHGCSARLPPPYLRPLNHFQFEAENTIPDLLDKFDITEAILVGHSDGATIGILASALRDNRIFAVVAEAGHWFVESRTLTSIRELLYQWSHSDLRKRLRKYHGDNVEGMFFGWTSLWLNPTFASFDVRPKLEAVDCPVLAIQGADDRYGTLDQLQALTSISGHLDAYSLRSCGHHPHIEARENYIKRVEKFLTERV
jgi:pimeloyl-ACP methyl ester carboxylesterase